VCSAAPKTFVEAEKARRQCLYAVDRRFKLDKRSQFFISAHNETLSVTAMRVSNPDCSPLGIHC
jgi:hypothetical protein